MEKKLYQALEAIQDVYNDDEKTFTSIFHNTDAAKFNDSLAWLNTELQVSLPAYKEKTLGFRGALYLMSDDAVNELIDFLWILKQLTDGNTDKSLKTSAVKQIEKYREELLSECGDRISLYGHDLINKAV